MNIEERMKRTHWLDTERKIIRTTWRTVVTGIKIVGIAIALLALGLLVWSSRAQGSEAFEDDRDPCDGYRYRNDPYTPDPYDSPYGHPGAPDRDFEDYRYMPPPADPDDEDDADDFYADNKIDEARRRLFQLHWRKSE